jgi:hypothetical protein
MNFVQIRLYNHFSSMLWGALICSHMAKTAQGLKTKVQKKRRFVLHIESWDFTYFLFLFLFLLVVLHNIICNVPTLIWMWDLWFFSRNFTSSMVLEFWVKTPSTKRILTHSYLQIYRQDFQHVCSTWFRGNL